MFGAMLSISVEKKVRNLITLCGGIFFISVPLVLAVTKLITVSMIASLLIFGVLVLLMHAINNIITGIAPLRLRDKTNSGRLAGVLNAFCYVGSTISSYLLGIIADRYGWNTVMYILMGATASAVVVGAAARLIQRGKSC